jgi:hypothetical protein
MMLGGLAAIACYISPNPSPLRWMVSGPPAAVARAEDRARTTPHARLLARAQDGATAFALFELAPALPYGDFMALTNLPPAEGLLSHAAPAVPSCPTEDPRGGAPIVGLFGDPAALAAASRELPWAKLTPLTTREGRQGLAFTPAEADAERYVAFVRRATDGALLGVEVVLMMSSKREAD